MRRSLLDGASANKKYEKASKDAKEKKLNK